jgi:hypothetical protein
MASYQSNWKKIYPLVAQRPQDYTALPLNSSGIYVMNANGLLDTERVDMFDGGKVASQSVDLETLTGNKEVVHALDYMLKTKKASFFPGTLLRDFGGFYLPVIPVISNGKIINERVQNPGGVFYDDKIALAEKLLGRDFAEKLKDYHGVDFEGPMAEFKDVLNEKATRLFENGLKSSKVQGFNALPIVCNEIFVIPDLYRDERVNLIAHCCNDLYESEEAREESYKSFAKKMKDRRLAERELYIASSQLGSRGSNYSNFTGLFVHEKGKLYRLK